MPRKKSRAKTKQTSHTVRSRKQRNSGQVFMSVAGSQKPSVQSTLSFWEKLNANAEANQSKLSMILGALIILVVGILVFNYFSRQQATLGPSQTTSNAEKDISPDNLPGKYTVKEGDTLFSIAEKYYQDGFKYENLAKANNLSNPDLLAAGQVLDIPKLSANLSPTPQPSPVTTQSPPPQDTAWGPAITTSTYTVAEGDWLSKIALRAYGDVNAYQKIAQANNIQNPDLIEPGISLKIPR